MKLAERTRSLALAAGALSALMIVSAAPPAHAANWSGKGTTFLASSSNGLAGTGSFTDKSNKLCAHNRSSSGVFRVILTPANGKGRTWTAGDSAATSPATCKTFPKLPENKAFVVKWEWTYPTGDGRKQTIRDTMRPARFTS